MELKPHTVSLYTIIQTWLLIVPYGIETEEKPMGHYLKNHSFNRTLWN